MRDPRLRRGRRHGAGHRPGRRAAADKLRVVFVTHGQAGDPYWNAVNVPTDPNEVRARVASVLQQDKTIDSLQALGPLGAVPMLRAVEETDSKGRLKAMATFDMTPEVLEKVHDGTLLFATDAQQFMMGYLPVVMFRLYKDYGVMPTQAWPTGRGFITKADAGEVLELSKKGYR